MINVTKPGNLTLVYWKDTIESFFHSSYIPIKYRIWAALHGFNPKDAWFKRINNNNKGDYLKDYTYYKSAPYNNPEYMYMVSKNCFLETLQDYPEYLPKYYAKIQNNRIEQIDISRQQNDFHGFASIIKLLEEKKVLAFKRLSGRAGVGFIVGKYHSNDFFTFNDVPYNRLDAEQYISSLDGYIVSEFVQQCTQYEKIWSKTTHTLRIQTCNVINGKADLVFSFLRFGSSKALHSISHVNDPGIYTAIIDIETGQTKTVITSNQLGQAIHATVHPDTGVNMLCTVPHWDLVVSKCLEMHNKKLSNLSWLGWDIVITEDGFRILEINTLSGLNGVEACDPIHASKELEPYFTKLINRNKKCTTQ